MSRYFQASPSDPEIWFRRHESMASSTPVRSSQRLKDNLDTMISQLEAEILQHEHTIAKLCTEMKTKKTSAVPAVTHDSTYILQQKRCEAAVDTRQGNTTLRRQKSGPGSGMAVKKIAEHERDGATMQHFPLDPTVTEFQPESRPSRESLPARELSDESQVSYADSTLRDMMSLQRAMIDNLTIPKATLPLFDGDPMKFWQFRRSFDSSVGQSAVDDATKLNRLISCCTGKAAKVVMPCVYMEPTAGYRTALNMLEERFGNRYQVAEAWISSLTEGPLLKSSDNMALQDFSDELRSCLETLKAMNMLEELDSRLRLARIVGRLPVFLQNRWRKVVVDELEATGRYPNIEKLVQFVRRSTKELNDPVFGFKPHVSAKDPARAPGGKRTTQVTPKDNSFTAREECEKPVERAPEADRKGKTHATDNRKCHACDGQHKLTNCQKFKTMTPEERIMLVRKTRLCYNCLESRHMSRDCKKSPCQCGMRHDALLHDAMKKPTTEEMSHAATASEADVALPVVPVLIKANGKTIRTAALLDPGGSRSFCDTSLIDDLDLTGNRSHIALNTLHGTRDIEGTEVSFEVKGTSRRHKSKLLSKVFAMKMPVLYNSVGDVSQWKHLKGLPLHSEDTVKLLIGQDHGYLLRPLEVRYGDDYGPYAVRTELGWMVNGPVGTCKPGVASAAAISAFVGCYDASEVLLADQVQKFWQLDMSGIPASSKSLSVEDKQVMELWKSSTRLVDGHYEMRIPFKTVPPRLPDNINLAETRLRQLTKRLMTDSEVFKMYNAEVQDLLSKGYAERVDGNDESMKCRWYLPHHNVNKSDNRFRIVFNCAARYEQVSLNQVCLQGPDLTNSLLGVILRFRERPVAVMGDVQSMFLQVKVAPEDRDVLRFLWWQEGDPSGGYETYRMTSHLFGGTWSPSCAAYALRRTADDHKDEFPKPVIEAVHKSFYVDDCLLSTQTKEEAVTLVEQLCDLLHKGGFHLRKWVSNSDEVLHAVPEADRGKQKVSVDISTCHSQGEKVLGIYWNTEKDCLSTRTLPAEAKLTKRSVLSTLSSLYDPMGLMAPYVVLAKIIFQDECRLSKGWDEPLDQANEQRWIKWLEELPILSDVHVDRCILPEGYEEAELHHFCDASTKAYGVVSYLRAVAPDGQVKCTFLLAKSRLVPLNGMTIPRLELQAATLAVQLDSMLHEELSLTIKSSTFWTDSMIVIGYIRNKSRRFKTFVANRLTVIHESTTPEQWRHVESEENPADDVSRGLDARQLKRSQRWLQGPVFLAQDKSSWTAMDESSDVPENDSEVKRETRSCAAVLSKEKEHNLTDKLSARFSSWFQLKRAVAWIMRFISWLKSKRQMKPDRYLATAELRRAEVILLKQTQATYYQDALELLRSGQGVPRGSPIHKLQPFLDDEGILRVTGRLQEAAIPDASKHPVIIPRQHRVAELIVRQVHECMGHVGREHTLAVLRKRYWITSCRPLINQVTRNCVVCTKIRAKGMQQQMASLPEDRVNPGQRPFSKVGIDCFGPFVVKRGRREEKRYGCIFTCLEMRAVHIEMMNSLDTDSFINALVRFSARRGTPELIRSDNGTNFVGAERELKRAVQRLASDPAVMRHYQWQEITWNFNPPHASNMGGVWERQIRSTRKILTAIVGTQILDDERLGTLFCEVESVINSRPLTAVSDDPNDLQVLTPNDLLLGGTNRNLPGDYTDKDCYSRRWRHVQFLTNQFWKRWSREYLSTLMLRQKWQKQQENLKIGDVVLVLDEPTQRRNWMLGRVLDTSLSHDGLVRSVQVKTASSVLNRPVSKLCKLQGV